jgi:uncharacterized secreted protein with C-terminal beta-propeller domain
MGPSKQGIIGLALVAVALGSTGCSTPDATTRPVNRDPGVRPGSLRLVAYDSCDAAMSSLKAAARSVVGPYAGLPAGRLPSSALGTLQGGAIGAAAPVARAGTAPMPGLDYSGTNTHEQGVDEPDLVKTDGHRIVTVTNGVLRVVDVATRRVSGELSLVGNVSGQPEELLLYGDRVLVLMPAMQAQPVANRPDRQTNGSDLVFVDLSGPRPRTAGRLTVDGSVLDARQVGGVARIVVRSAPRLQFPYDQTGSEAEQIAANQKVIDNATADDWLPRYSLSIDGRTTVGRVDCQQVSRPTHYSGTTMLTVYTLDLGRSGLTPGEPATVVADGEIVYGTGTSLYIASDDRWLGAGWRGGGLRAAPSARTELYKFDVSRPRRPVFVASGEVPGWLVNQYALSEYQGALRVVTTTDRTIWGGPAPTNSESALYVLWQRGEDLAEVGRVVGLGKGERVYSVRFVGPTGYVVTFRQTDPLYTLDLRDPTNPKVVGELKITGYSAYLHPAGEGRLIGIGQEASTQGRVLGTQVSLFDVRDPANPERLTRYQLGGGHSEAEFDPHAFLYWPKTGLLVIPFYPNGSGALALTVDSTVIRELGRVGQGRLIRRSLVIGDTLWTVSEMGLGRSSLTTLATEAWIPF